MGTLDPAGRRLRMYGAVGVLAQLVFIAGWIVPQSWQGPRYSPMRDTISDLTAQTAPHAWVPVCCLAVAGVGTIVFALFGLRPALAPAGRVAAYAPWMLAVSQAGLGNLLLYPRIACRVADGCDRAQQLATVAGKIDAYVGGLAVVILINAMFPLARRMRELPAWAPLSRPTLLVGVLSWLLLVLFLMPQTAPVHGLVERVLATGNTIWIGVLAARLIRTTARSRPPVITP